MSLYLKSVETEAGRITATYNLSHHGPKTVLDLEVKISIDSYGSTASFSVETPKLEDSGKAIVMLSEWLERAALAIKAAHDRSGKSMTLPLFDGMAK